VSRVLGAAPADHVDHADRELAQSLVAAVGRFRRAARRAAGQRPGQRLTPSQVELVLLVRDRPGLSVQQAAGELRLAANSVSTLVRALMDQGMLERLPDPADRRVARLRLTDAARDRIQAWQDRRTDAVTAAMAGAPAAGIAAADRAGVATTIATLEALAQRMDRA
jgi:DNA-binding MarR family transcriptional regulator